MPRPTKAAGSVALVTGANGGIGLAFVPARAGGTGIVAVDVHANDRDHGAGQTGELCRTLIRFV
jgi:NAD(P)-dependent dehydrogenase (short-subunit alcohol dehydrogenase family)